MTLLPYSPPNLPGTFKRVIVKPIPKEEQNTPEGLLIPSDIGRICEIGIAMSVCEDSAIIPGDRVLYAKIDRKSDEHLDTISIEGIKCDVLYENEIWSVNGFPYNRIFVEPFSELQMNEDGLILPDGAKGVTQKGRVFRSPADYTIKAGDHIEYRHQEREIYPTVDIDGARYEVLFESDVFIVNGYVAPYRIIVKIDIAAQRIKRNSTESGLLRSQLFLYMLYNMQVGEVLEIGEEAQNNYPELRVGDSVIIHHTIEAQAYRLIKKEYGKHDKSSVIYEHRIINAWDKDSREILGRIVNRKKMLVAPFGKSVFLDWKFDVFTSPRQSDSLFLEFESNLDKCHAIDDLKNTIEHKKKDGFGKAHAKIRGITDILAKTNPEVEREKFDRNESELKIAQQEATKVGNYLQANHLLQCKVAQSGENILVPYKELYPIIIFGKKFLIAYKDFIIAEAHTNNMGTTYIEPLADRLIVKPIIEENTSELLIPDSAKEKPQKGEVIAVGAGKDDKPLRAKVGEIVLYRKGAGVSLPGDEGHLMMKEGIDTIGIVHILAD